MADEQEEPARTPFGDHWRDLPHDGPAPSAPGWATGTGYGYVGGYTPSVTDKGARQALVLGVVSVLTSLFCCGLLFGPAAIVEGLKARRRIAQPDRNLLGGGLAMAGIVLGIAGLALSAAQLGLQLLVDSRVFPTSGAPR